MKNNLLVIITMALSLVPASVLAQAARDWHDFHKFHIHVEEAIHEVEIARGADHYGMDVHDRQTEYFLRLAEKDLLMADKSTNSG